MQIEELKKLVLEMELVLEFENIEAERCSACCDLTAGGC